MLHKFFANLIIKASNLIAPVILRRVKTLHEDTRARVYEEFYTFDSMDSGSGDNLDCNRWVADICVDLDSSIYGLSRKGGGGGGTGGGGGPTAQQCADAGLQLASTGDRCEAKDADPPVPVPPGEEVPNCGIDGTWDASLGICIYSSTIESCEDQGKVWVGPGLPCADKQEDGGLLIPPPPIPPRSRTRGPRPADPSPAACPPGQAIDPETGKCELTFTAEGTTKVCNSPKVLIGGECVDPPSIVPTFPPVPVPFPNPTTLDLDCGPAMIKLPGPNGPVCIPVFPPVPVPFPNPTTLPPGGAPSPPLPRPQINLGGLLGGGNINVGTGPSFARPFSVGAGPGDTLFPAQQAQPSQIPGGLLDFIASLRR